MPLDAYDKSNALAAAFVGGAIIGTLGGLIGLGGAEFRLPLLIGIFGFLALHAIILNKAMSLVVVAAALLFRSPTIPWAELLDHWMIIGNLLAGSLAGAWLGAAWATRLRTVLIYKVIAFLLLLIAAILFGAHDLTTTAPALTGYTLIGVGIAAGFFIGAVASILGVAGGELLIPTLILLFGVEVKLAGSLSLAISLPTMLVGFVRYSRDRSFSVLTTNKAFVAAMALGSIVGALLGGALLPFVASNVLLPMLSVILLISAAKMWLHREN